MRSCGLGLLIIASCVGCLPATLLWACYDECSNELTSSDEVAFDAACNDTCKVEKCKDGCNLFTNAISSSCHEICEEETKSFKNKLDYYCTRGCNIAINMYMKMIAKEVGTPDEPYLVADSRKNTSLTIRWQPSNHDNISYLIQWRYDGYHPTDFEYYRPMEMLKKNTLKIEGLHPYTKYRFRVAWIVLENYPALFSDESVVISTLEYGVPSTPPVITCLTAVSSSGISVNWDPPAFPNGPILAYYIYILSYYDGSFMIKELSDTTDGLYYVINSLKPSTTYEISLSTRNKIGEGPASEKRNITTLPKKEISSVHFPAYLVFGSKNRVLKQGLRYLIDESFALFKTRNESNQVKGIALHVKKNEFFASDTLGNVFRVNFKKNPVRTSKVIASNEHHPEILSFDHLNENLYMAEDNQISRCDADGNNYKVIVTDMEYRPEDMHVDPLNGYLYVAVLGIGAGLYRIDLIEFERVAAFPFAKSHRIICDDHLKAFTVDYKNFRLIVPSSSNNTILASTLDGSEVLDIRENAETRSYSNINSLAIHQDLLYYTTGNLLFSEEFHKSENKFYSNSLFVEGPLVSLKVHHYEEQPHPIPLNPVENVEALFAADLAMVSWSKPRLLGGQGKGSWQTYLYEVELLDHTNGLTVVGTNISANFFQLNDLKPDTAFSIKVRAYTEGGKGPWSKSFSGTTLKNNFKEARILYGTKEGLTSSSVIGDDLKVLVPKMNINNNYITDISYLHSEIIVLNTNATAIYVFNKKENSLKKLSNITSSTSIAVDWLAPKIYFAKAEQMISRCNLDGTQVETLLVFGNLVKELAVDSMNGFLYFATSHSVERTRLNGMDHFVYMKHPLFSGKQVTGLTLDFDEGVLLWIVRSFEGSLMYRACLPKLNELKCQNEQLVASLGRDGSLGPFTYFQRRMFFVHDNEKAFVSDRNGNNFARIDKLSYITAIEIADPSLQPYPYPDSYYNRSLNVVPSSINTQEMHVVGNPRYFNITFNPDQVVNYGDVFYDITVDDGDEIYSLVTVGKTVFTYPTMKHLPPYSPLTVKVKSFTYWATSSETISLLHSPQSVPSEPLHSRAFVTHGSSLFDERDVLKVIFRWSPPKLRNGVVLYYHIVCFLLDERENRTLSCDNKVDGNIFEFESLELRANSSYLFQVNAATKAGAGPPCEFVKVETSVERPVPKLLLAKENSVRVADIDFREERLLFSKALQPASIAYLADEHKVFWLEEKGALMVSKFCDGTNASTYMIKHLTSEASSLAVDWIARELYYVEIDKIQGYSEVHSVDLSYKFSRNILNTSNIIGNIEVEPFTRSLIYTLTKNNHSELMICDLSGSNARPLFSQWRGVSNKVKRGNNDRRSCNCNPDGSIGEAIAIDTSDSIRNVLYSDTKGNIYSSDLEGCKCTLLLNATSNINSGLPPTAITADKSFIYYFNKREGKVYTLAKNPQMNRQPLVHDEIKGIRSIRAIGVHLQPMPDEACLILSFYKGKADLDVYTFHSLTLRLPPVVRPRFCDNISLPSLLFRVYYEPLLDDSSGTCGESDDKICKSVTTYNNELTIGDLEPFTKYVIRISVESYYNKKPALGPPVLYRTDVGTPSAPINVTAAPITPFEIRVEWKPPFIPNGYPIFYEVRWKTKNSTRDSLSTIQSECGKEFSTSLTATILTTEPGKDHFVTVRAYSANCKLYSSSEEVIVSALDVPSNLTLMKATSNSLKLLWIEDTNITNYFIEYKQMDDKNKIGWSKAFATPESTRTSKIFAITNLSSKSKYKVKVFLDYTGRGKFFAFPERSDFHFTTLGDVPSAPGRPQVKNVGREVYTVFWSESVNYGFSEIIYELHKRSDEIMDWVFLTNSSITQYILSNYSGNANYEFRVRAMNENGGSNYSYSEKSFYLPLTDALIDTTDDSFRVIMASTVPAFLLFVFLAILYAVHRRKEKEKKVSPDMVSPDEVVTDLELANLHDLPLHGNFVHQNNALYNLNDLSPHEEGQLEGTTRISREQIIVTRFLGSGAFGEVFEGLVYGFNSTESLKIAIKTLKKGATEYEKEEFLKEAKLMSNFKHDHILELLGVCFDNHPNFIVLELMEGGDLLSFLRNSRSTLEHNSLTMDDLIRICIDVAKGCKYLEDMHFVHRDLAARNCLVSSYDRNERIVKIGDFGLARDIYKCDYYRKEGQGMLPVRWMAPESLIYGVFTSQSDIWAFGVLLFEVMTLGSQPYPARSNIEVLHYVRAGGRLDKPENCPDDLHEIMLACWSYESERRPTFCYCLNALEELRTKLLASPIALRPVYNANYSNEPIGTYIGRCETQGNEQDKLLDQNFDSRSTQSDPPTLTDLLEIDATLMRRSLSWTSTIRKSLDASSTAKQSSKPKPFHNKYLELLDENEDSNGYQLPLKLVIQPQQKCNEIFPQNTQHSQPLDIPLSGDSDSEEQLLESLDSQFIEQFSSASDIDILSEYFDWKRPKSLISNDSNNACLDECDTWSFETASTATCHFDSSVIDDVEVSALSCIAGVHLNHTPKSSDC